MSLETVLDVLEGLVGGLPVVKLAQQVFSLGVKLRSHKVLFEDAAHDPREDVGATGERGRQLADEAVVRDAEVAELEGEADEVGDEVWGVDAAVDEDGALVVDAPDKRDARAVSQDAAHGGLEAQRVGAAGVAKVPQLGGGAHEDARLVVGEGPEGDAGHGADADAGVGDDAEVDELLEEHDADGHALRVGGDEDEVCAANVLDPVEQQLPEVVDAVADAALALERHLFDLADGAVAVAVRLGPPPDRVGGQVRRGEEAVDADGDGLADLGRIPDAEDVLGRRLRESASATALAVSTLAGAFVSVSACVAGSADLSATVPFGGVEAAESVSMDVGRALLLRRHVDLPSFGLGSAFADLDGGLDTSPSAMGVGCASEPSPMTAISPDSGSGGLPSFLGESRDQNAHVEPALGAGSGSCFGGGGGAGGGASSMTTSSGSLAAASLAAESCLTEALLDVPRNPNHDVDGGGGGSLLGASTGGSSVAVCAGGVLGLSWSAALFVSGTGGLAISAVVAVFGVRDHHPSQLLDVGCCGVEVRVAACWSGSCCEASPVLSASDGFNSGWASCVCSVFASFVWAGSLPFGSGGASSGTLDSDGAWALRRLAASSPFFGSKRVRSGVPRERTVPPRMFSRATDVEADALLGVRGHDPYQLFALRTFQVAMGSRQQPHTSSTDEN
ncbi:hypothetical protein O9K51_05140 [Purpureocillium lavendulum]|uniref:Uncharacterized protein n=1 Tax=Purpureocillium lavendulum TaxID=1247861 RepID=A0AB34FRZ8_9HYPO|nr:hypothetical protein O9K51_05140 [Purpureocillium lavendulum]